MRKYLTIGELSDLLNLSAHTIRYYEKEELIKPKHTTDKGYRLYDYDDMFIVSSVMVLRDSQIPIKDIRELIADYNKEDHVKLLNQSKVKIDEEIERLCELRVDVERTLKSINYEDETIGKFIEKKLPQRFFRIIRFSDYDMNYSLKELYDLYKNNNISTDELYKADIYYVLQEDTIGYGVLEFEPVQNAIQIPLDKGNYITYSFIAKNDQEIMDYIGKFAWHLTRHRLKTEGELMLRVNSTTLSDGEEPVVYELQIKLVD